MVGLRSRNRCGEEGTRSPDVPYKPGRRGESHCRIRRSVKNSEEKYTTELEGLTGKWDLQNSYMWLVARPVLIRTDHAALLEEVQANDRRISRWISKFQQFNITWEDVSGKNNELADSVSRYCHLPQLEARTVQVKGWPQLLGKVSR